MQHTPKTLDLTPDEAIELGLELIRAGQDLNALDSKRSVASFAKPCVDLVSDGMYSPSRFTFVVQRSS